MTTTRAATVSEAPATRFAKDHLKSFVERIERLLEEKQALASDIRDVYAEAKANGYDAKALRAIVRLRKLDAAERAEQEAILETYMHALGMLSDTPLGQAAIKRDLAGEKAQPHPPVPDKPPPGGAPLEMPDIPPGLRRTRESEHQQA